MIIRYARYVKNLIMTTPKKNIISIVGTTGVGKSQFSIELANAINGEVINADSMQVYKGLDIITNKHPVAERYGVSHHVMNHVDWNEEYYIHRYAQEAQKAIEDIHSRGKIPIVIGGTHYYLQNLLFNNKTIGQDEKVVSKNKKILTQEERDILDGDVAVIFDKLMQIDPIIAHKFHPQDRRKLRRALEIYLSTGKKPSEIYHEQKLEEFENSSLKYNTLIFWVYSDPDILKPRLDKRVDKMMESGGLQEIKELYDFYRQQEPEPDLTKGIWQVIGFKEFLPWLKNIDDKSNFDEGMERMKIRTRQYAKYQVKWIRKLLAIELQKESRFQYKYGGKIYVLDATDLDKWDTEVGKIGVEIAETFLNEGPLSVKHPQTPDNLQELLPTPEMLKNSNSNKTIDSNKNWKHYFCDICTDKSGKPLVAVGDENWMIHMKSARHRRKKQSLEKRHKHEARAREHSLETSNFR